MLGWKCFWIPGWEDCSVLRVEVDESLLGSPDAFWSRSPVDDVFLLRGDRLQL